MKQVIYTDQNGLQHKSILRDGDTDPSIGLLQSPPDILSLDWEGIAKTIHNKLLEANLLTIQDIQIRSADFNKIILATVGKRIYALYQNGELEK